MRRLITGMKMSLDGRIEGPQGYADWVQAWSEDYGITQQIDACVLGGGMYPGYETYWTSIQNEPGKQVWITGNPPTAAEIEWARFAAHTPHYVISTTLNSASWPNTRFLRSLEELAALKQQPGKDIYLMGGARVTAALLDAGLLDELRLIVYPVVAGEGKPLFAEIKQPRHLKLHGVQPLPDGLVSMTYTVL